MEQNTSSKNNMILLFDSSMNFKDVYSIIQEKKPKIITFDYESHVLFEEKNIPHEISDAYLSKGDLDYIQEKSYLFAHWHDQPKISNLLEYDGINIGELFFYDFHYQLVPILKKFFEIMKIFECNKNSTYFSSFILHDIISSFSTSVFKLEIDFIDTTIHDGVIKIKLNFGIFSFPIKLKYVYLKKLTKIYQRFFRIFLFKKNIDLQNTNTVLLVDFSTKRYNYLLKTFNKFSINLVKFDRLLPAIWNFESYKIIKKSNCLVENYTSLIDKPLKHLINSEKSLLKSKTNSLWQQNKFFESFFSFNDKSFWIIIKPILIKMYEQKSNEAIEENELLKKLFKKYNFNSVLVWSEMTMTHFISIKLAKKQNIPIYQIQHGLHSDNPEYAHYAKFQRGIPKNIDKFLIWGNTMKKYLTSLDFQIPTKIVGNPIYDSFSETKNEKILSQNEFILLATTPPETNYVKDLTVDSMQNYLTCIKKICEVISKLDKKLIIKTHPLSDLDIVPLVKKIDPKIIVVEAGDITPLIKLCEVFIVTDISTTILEAQILKKPVILVQTRDSLIPKKENSLISVHQKNFEETLIKTLTNNEFNLKIIEHGTIFANNYLSNLGNASKHLIEFLDQTEFKN